MKSVKSIFTVIALFAFLNCGAQVHKDDFCDLKKTRNKKFNFLKSFRLPASNANGDVEYSYILAKGTKYRIQLCVNDSRILKDVVLILYNKSRKIVGSTDQMRSGDRLDFSCTESGIYYIHYVFKQRNSEGIMSILSFAR